MGSEPLKASKPRGPVFVKAFKAILRDPRIIPLDKTIWLLIKTHANTDGSNCFPSMERIAGYAGVSIRTVMRSVERLEQWTILSASRKGRTENNTYKLDDAYFAKELARPFRGDTGVRSPTRHGCHVTETQGTDSEEPCPRLRKA